MRSRPLLLASLAALAVLAAGCGSRSPAGASGLLLLDRRNGGPERRARLRPLHALTRLDELARPHERRSVRQVEVAADRLQHVAHPLGHKTVPCNHLLGSTVRTVDHARRSRRLPPAGGVHAHARRPRFPDPTFRGNGVQTNIPPSINQDAPSFRRAAATCTKLIPAGLPYSSRQHS